MSKVYGWIGYRREAGGPHGQTREIVAAPSMAAVGRIVGENPRRLWNLGETGNAREIEAASARPGIVLWRLLDDHAEEYRP